MESTLAKMAALVVGSLLILVWAYLLARLVSYGVVKSWFDFMQRSKKEKKEKETDDE